MCALRNEGLKYGAQLFRGHGTSQSTVAADGSVLTENTAEIAARKKDGAGTAGAGNAGLFPKMQCRPGDVYIAAAFANADFSGPVDSAGARAAGTAGDRLFPLWCFLLL